MVRTVDSFMGWRSASASRTSSAVAEARCQRTPMIRCSSSLRGLRGLRALSIVALLNVARHVNDVKGLPRNLFAIFRPTAGQFRHYAIPHAPRRFQGRQVAGILPDLVLR